MVGGPTSLRGPTGRGRRHKNLAQRGRLLRFEPTSRPLRTICSIIVQGRRTRSSPHFSPQSEVTVFKTAPHTKGLTAQPSIKTKRRLYTSSSPRSHQVVYSSMGTKSFVTKRDFKSYREFPQDPYLTYIVTYFICWTIPSGIVMRINKTNGTLTKYWFRISTSY